MRPSLYPFARYRVAVLALLPLLTACERDVEVRVGNVSISARRAPQTTAPARDTAGKPARSAIAPAVVKDTVRTVVYDTVRTLVKVPVATAAPTPTATPATAARPRTATGSGAAPSAEPAARSAVRVFTHTRPPAPPPPPDMERALSMAIETATTGGARVIDADGRDATFACTERVGIVVVEASRATVRLTGPCAVVSVDGDGSRVFIERTGLLGINGNRNAIEVGRAGIVQDEGIANTLRRGGQ